MVKAGGDLSCARLKGAIAPEEFLVQPQQGQSRAEFREVDPREGFSVRNFQIQAAKTAMISDVIVYGDDPFEVLKLAKDVATAQQAWRASHERQGHEVPLFHTFLCKSPFSDFENHHPEIVAVDSQGHLTGNVMDFFRQERLEMCTMTKASEIDHNVWLGPTPDPVIDPELLPQDEKFDIHIECSDLGRINALALQAIAERSAQEQDEPAAQQPYYLEFPSSGSIMPPTWSHTEADGILETCKWIYHLAHGILPPPSDPTSEDPSTETTTTPSTLEDLNDAEGDSPMTFPGVRPASTFPGKKILIHCMDGYTESTMLALAYFTYATGLPIPTAWLRLHVEKKRNFFAYPSDVALLTCIAPRLLTESPALRNRSLSEITELAKDEPGWLRNMDGSLPSRVTDYMYLGNLGHANNPELLRELGIGQILSVGETANWRDGELEKWGRDNIMVVQRVQDNGVDPLTDEFDRCLEFIGTLD